MATNWHGYLLRAVETERIFPDEYIQIESWDSTPNQREEIKAERDDNTRDLIRVTAQGKKSKFAFATRDNLTLEEKIEIQKFFTDAESNHAQRKIKLEYWNDEENDYKQGFFYRPNMDFPIKKITDTTVYYKSLTFTFVEY